MSHARLSPSAWSRWSKCPASVKGCELIPDTTSAAAQWGTDAHTLLEDMVLYFLALSMVEISHPDLDDFDAKYQVALGAFNYATSRYNEAVKAGLNPVMYAESKLKPGLYTGRDDGDGTGDIVIACDEWIEIIDLKGGQGIPVYADSGQLKIYGLGAMAKIEEAEKGITIPSKMICTIVQPRLPIDGETVRSITYTVEEMLDWCDNVYIPAAKATDSDYAQFVPGEDQCRFCANKPTCKAVKGKVEELCGSTFALGIIRPKPVNKLSMDSVVSIIEAAPMIRGWLDSIEKYAHARLLAHKPVPGYKLVKSGGRNTWNIDTDDVVNKLSRGKDPIPKKLLTKTELLSAPKALKIAGLSNEQKERMQKLISKSEGKLALAPVTDSRADAVPALPFKNLTFLD